MVVRIAPPGGRTRRKGGAVSLSSGDVPIVTPASDPGVRIPSTDFIGGALKSVGNVLGEGADLALQVVQRDEGLARDADDTAFADFGQDLVRDLQKAGTLSDSAVVESAGARLLQEQQRILNEHRGGETSRLILENSLTKRRNSVADTLAVLNINAADVQLNQTVKKRISSIVQEVLSDPDVLVSEDPMEAFRFYSGEIEEVMDFLELNPAQRRVVEPAAQAQVALSMIGPLIRNKQFDRAITILRSEEVGAVMSPGDQRDAIRRIVTAQKKLEEVVSEGQKFLQTARELSPPNATEEVIRDTARELAGLEEGGEFKIIDLGGGNVIAVDESTLKVSRIVSGPSIEEDAEREAAIEKAKLLARKDVLSSIAVDAGLGQLFGVGPTISTNGEGEKSQPAKTTAEGKEDEPTGPEVVPPISEEAISAPFGPEETPASSDMQSVLGLMTLSRRLLLIGDNASANGLLSQARMIIDNSREIQEQRELDKPITNLEMLRDLGLPLGATMRQGAGRILSSAEQLQSSRQRGGIISLDTAREFQVPPNSTRGELEAILSDRERSEGGSAVPRTFEERAQALDEAKLLTPGQASELGFPFGTTRGEASGRRLRSPEERAQARAIASTRGREQVKAEEQLAFIDEARVQINDLLEELKEDPTLVGGVGALRATGRSAITFLEDIGFGNLVSSARDIAFEESELGLDEVTGFFDDPTLSSLDIIANSTGLILARLRTPAGRIPVELIKLSIKDVGLKGLRGSVVVQDRLKFVLGLLDQRDENIRSRFPNLQEPEETGTSEEQVIPPDTPRFRFEGGKLVPVSPDGVSGGGSSERPFSSTDEDLQDVGDRASERFPRLRNFDFVLQRGSGPGQLEFFPPDEGENPNPGRATIEVRNTKLKGRELEDAIVGDALHLLGNTEPVFDPEFRQLKEQFISLMSQKEIEFAKKRFAEHKKEFSKDRRSFDQWFDQVWADAWIRGLIVPDKRGEFVKAKNKALTKKQIKLVDEMRNLLKAEELAE